MTPNPLYDVIDLVWQARESEEDKLWSRVLDKLVVALDCEAGTYYSYAAAKRQLLPRHAVGPNADDLKATPVDIRTGLAGWAASHREPLLVPDAYKDARFLREVDEVTGFRTRDCLVMPLFDRLELVGVVQLLNKRGGSFGRDDLQLAAGATRIASLGLRVLKLEATVDKVTARNASIIENLGGGFIAVDMHGRVILCNPAARRILQLPADVKLNQPVDQVLVHVGRLADILLDAVATRKTVKRQEFEWSHRGETRLLGYSTILIQDPQGELAGAGVTFQDITKKS